MGRWTCPECGKEVTWNPVSTDFLCSGCGLKYEDCTCRPSDQRELVSALRDIAAAIRGDPE